jgi:hypothetical protein
MKGQQRINGEISLKNGNMVDQERDSNRLDLLETDCNDGKQVHH